MKRNEPSTDSLDLLGGEAHHVHFQGHFKRDSPKKENFLTLMKSWLSPQFTAYFLESVYMREFLVLHFSKRIVLIDCISVKGISIGLIDILSTFSPRLKDPFQFVSSNQTYIFWRGERGQGKTIRAEKGKKCTTDSGAGPDVGVTET
jgi:hypothetical protein